MHKLKIMNLKKRKLQAINFTRLTKRKKNKLLLLLLLFIFINSYSQNITIDLSEKNQESVKKTVNSDSKLTIKATNLLLKDDTYTISVNRVKQDIPEIPTPSVAGVTPDADGGVGIAAGSKTYLSSGCELEDDIIDLFSQTDELILSNKIKKLNKTISSDFPNTCDPTKDPETIKEIISKTEKILWDDELKNGEEIVIEITKKNADGSTKKWKHVYSTEARGKWQVSYGFSFITQGFNSENLYYSATETTSGANPKTSYRIKKEINRGTLKFAPSIFFTWMPTSRLNKNDAWGLSGGLGFDFENPTVFFSGTYSFNQNIKIHAGIVFHKQQTLLGKYKENQEINEPLSREQLHEELYKINPFISLSYRFSSNPFSQSK